MEIGGLQKVSLIDYPKKIACTIFLTGCNFSCPWCYSKQLVWPAKIKKLPKISEKYFLNFLKKRKNLLEGCIFCGGEPTLHKELPVLAKKIKRMGYFLKLDTNGSRPSMVKKLIDEKLIDYIAMDVKAPLTKEKYKKAVGSKIDLNEIKESLKIIKQSGIGYEFRTTIIPFIHTNQDIIQIAKEIAPAHLYYLQEFQPDKNIGIENRTKLFFNQKQLRSIQKECNKYLPTQIRKYY